jgi:hypothetical protein
MATNPIASFVEKKFGIIEILVIGAYFKFLNIRRYRVLLDNFDPLHS